MGNIGMEAGSEAMQVVGSTTKGAIDLTMKGMDITQKLLDFIFNLILNTKKMREHTSKEVTDADRLKGIDFGEINIDAFNEFKDKAGFSAEHINSIPAEDIPRMNELAKKYGVSFSVVDISPSNSATIILPTEHLKSYKALETQVIKEKESKRPDDFTHKTKVVSNDEMEVVDRVMSAHDVPYNSLVVKENGESKMMFIVEKQYEQEFDKAFEKANILKEKADNVEIIEFKQDMDLSDLDYVAKTLTIEEAIALNKSLGGDVSLVQFQKNAEHDNKVDIKYSAIDKEKVEKHISENYANRTNSDEFVVGVVNGEISIAKSLRDKTEQESKQDYFTRIPGQQGNGGYVKLSVADFKDDGKGNLTGKLNGSVNYTIYAATGNSTGKTMTGDELSRSFDTSAFRFKDNGYRVKAFNLMNMEHSSNYNPFHYLYDFKGDYNPNNVNKMISTFVINTKGDGSSQDPFWDEASKMFLAALCFLIVETAETREEQNFSSVLKLIHLEKVIEGKEDEVSDLGKRRPHSIFQAQNCVVHNHSVNG